MRKRRTIKELSPTQDGAVREVEPEVVGDVALGTLVPTGNSTETLKNRAIAHTDTNVC